MSDSTDNLRPREVNSRPQGHAAVGRAQNPGLSTTALRRTMRADLPHLPAGVIRTPLCIPQWRRSIDAHSTNGAL